MTAEILGFISQLPIALALAGVFLVAGFLVTRLAFREKPVARFLCQLASFGGFTFMLLAAGVSPSEPTPKEGAVFAFFAVSVFKIVLVGRGVLAAFRLLPRGACLQTTAQGDTVPAGSLRRRHLRRRRPRYYQYCS